MARYPILEDGQWLRPTRRGFKEQCCDCGLVHRMDFRLVNGTIEFRVFRDKRATARARQGLKKRVIVIDG